MDRKLIFVLLLSTTVASVGLLAVSAQVIPAPTIDMAPTTNLQGAVIENTTDIMNASNVSLNLFKTYQNASYVTAGIGVRNTGRGIINLRVPDGTTLIDAWLYWKILNSTAGTHDNEITVNGIRVIGKQIGSGPSPCWAGNGFAYRANINSVIQSTDDGRALGFNIGGMNTLITDGRSPWDAFSLPAAEDVGLVIIFKDPQNPTSTVTIFDGYSEHSGGITIFNQVPVGTSMFSSIIGDGQVIGVQPYIKSVSFTRPVGPTEVSVTLQNVTLNGVAPSIISKATYQGSLSDIDTFILPSTALPGATLKWNLANDCVAYDALVFQGSALTNMTPTPIETAAPTS